MRNIPEFPKVNLVMGEKVYFRKHLSLIFLYLLFNLFLKFLRDENDVS